jgi:hypothetical protein
MKGQNYRGECKPTVNFVSYLENEDLISSSVSVRGTGIELAISRRIHDSRPLGQLVFLLLNNRLRCTDVVNLQAGENAGSDDHIDMVGTLEVRQ